MLITVGEIYLTFKKLILDIDAIRRVISKEEKALVYEISYCRRANIVKVSTSAPGWWGI